MYELNRPILSLWPYLFRALAPFAILALLAILPGFPLIGIPVWAILLLYSNRRNLWLWRLARQVRCFHTARNGRIILHYAPELNSTLNIPKFLHRCQAELDRLTDRFGFPLRSKTKAYLFANQRVIADIFGPYYGGAALSFANSIAIADSPKIQESIRHEFAHLFSARWTLFAPPLLSEGLSVYLQETWWGKPIDKEALPIIRNKSLKLPLLLKPNFFFGDMHRHSCYILAGSFTGFLIRRHGWETYREFYRLCDGIRTRAKFNKVFGLTLEDAECQWRDEIVIMEVLNRRLKWNSCF